MGRDSRTRRKRTFEAIASTPTTPESTDTYTPIEHGADLTLLDEREGRQVARRHGLDVTGVVGVLLRGERAGTVDLQVELDALRAAGFWIGEDLYSEVLRRGSADRD